MIKLKNKGDYTHIQHQRYNNNLLIPTFAECSEEESFSRSRGMTNGSKRGVRKIPWSLISEISQIAQYERKIPWLLIQM